MSLQSIGKMHDFTIEPHMSFRPLDGWLETDVAHAMRAPTRPAVVVKVLCKALTAPDGKAYSEDDVAAMPLGQVRYLMAKLAQHFEADERWITSSCSDCNKPFDFPISLAALPYVTKGEAVSTVETSLGAIGIRQPCAGDHIAIAGLPQSERKTELLSLTTGQTAQTIAKFSVADLEAIDLALGDLSPQYTTAAAASCPACGQMNAVPISTSDWLADVGEGPFEDVHTIASAYGWSEDEILTLPRWKRANFVQRIDQSHGITRGKFE
jgi:hypothetical protein